LSDAFDVDLAIQRPGPLCCSTLALLLSHPAHMISAMRLGFILLLSIFLSANAARAADNSTQSGADLITKA
jgi:hypothetical protein